MVLRQFRSYCHTAADPWQLQCWRKECERKKQYSLNYVACAAPLLRASCQFVLMPTGLVTVGMFRGRLVHKIGDQVLDVNLSAEQDKLCKEL